MAEKCLKQLQLISGFFVTKFTFQKYELCGFLCRMEASLGLVNNQTFGKNDNDCQLKFLCKIEIFFKNKNIWQKSKYLSKIEISVKNSNICQKLKCLSKIEIFVKNWNICQKLKYLSKIKIFVKNWNICQKLKYLSKIKIFDKNENICSESKFLSIENTSRNGLFEKESRDDVIFGTLIFGN